MEEKMVNMMLKMYSAMEEKLAERDAVRDAAMKNEFAEMMKGLVERDADRADRDAVMKKKDFDSLRVELKQLDDKFDDLKKKLEDKEDEAGRGKHGPP